MQVHQQLTGPGGGLPVDVLHGIPPHIAPQASKLEGVVIDLLPAEGAAHQL